MQIPDPNGCDLRSGRELLLPAGVVAEAMLFGGVRGAVRYAVVASRGVWRSLVARFVRDEEVVGSNPATPTREIRWYVSYPRALAFVGGISVDHRGSQFGQRVNQVVFGVVGDAMRGSQAQRGVDVEFGIGVQAVADPAHPHAAH